MRIRTLYDAMLNCSEVATSMWIPIAQHCHNFYHNIYHKVGTSQGWQAHALFFVLPWHVHKTEVQADMVYLGEDVMLEVSFQLVFRSQGMRAPR